MQAFNSALLFRLFLSFPLLFQPSPYLALLFPKNAQLSQLFGQRLLESVEIAIFPLSLCPLGEQQFMKYFDFNLSHFLEVLFLHFHYEKKCCSQWLGWVMVLGSFQCQGVLLLLDEVGQGPAVLAAGVGWVGYIFIFFIYLPFLMSCL